MNKAAYIFLLFIGGTTLFGCQEESKKLETVKTSKYDEFVRNPIAYGKDVDSSAVAQISFDTQLFDFGTIDEGEVIAHTFQFTNTGKQPLLISEARSTCGCTVPEWPKELIQPGEGGAIKVVFNSENKSGYQDKPVTIYANTLPGKTVIRVKGTVNKK